MVTSMECGSARAPGHNVKDGVLVFTCCVGGGESRHMHLTPGIEIAVPEALEEGIDDRGVQHFSAPPDGACDGMM